MYSMTTTLWNLNLWILHLPCYPDVSQLISTVTLHIMMGSTMRRALTASCPKTPPSSLMESLRDDTFSSSVRLFIPLHCWFECLVNMLTIWHLLILTTSPSLFYYSVSSSKARTGALEPSELEIFKKQAECLQFLPEYYFGGTGQSSLVL